MNLLLIQEQLLALYNTLPPSFNGYKNAEATEEILEEVKKVEAWIKETMLCLLNHYNKNQFSDDINRLTLENIKEIFSNIINQIAEELYEKYYVIYQNDIESLKQSAKDLYDPLIFLQRDSFLTKHMNSVYEGEENYKAACNINYAQNEYFTVHQEIPKNQKDFSFYVIYPKYKRAVRDFTDTKVALNLNLSEDELVDYIKKIKKNYDSKNSIIKTKRELLEEELEGFDNKVLKADSAAKWADNFFIYDYFLYHKVNNINKKESDIKREIQIEFIKFHGIRVLKDNSEIKNSKDTKYKYIPLEEYKTQEGYSQDDDIFETLLDENQAISIRAIEDKYKLLSKYIQGEDPLYKKLLEK